MHAILLEHRQAPYQTMTSLPPITPWHDIPGERVDFDAEHAVYELLAVLRSARLFQVPKTGAPTRWYPGEAWLEYQGRRFEAELIGSSDGQTWLWSWANPHLDFPDEALSIARKMKEAAPKLPALGVPHIGDSRLGHAMGQLAVGLGFADGYYAGNDGEYIFAIRRGQLEGLTIDPLEELQRYLEAAPLARPDQLDEALERIEAEFGLTPDRSESLWLTIQDKAGHTLRLFCEGTVVRPILAARCFTERRRSLDDIVEHLRKNATLRKLDMSVADEAVQLRALGLKITITRIEKLRALIAEVKSLHGEADQARARTFGAVFRIEFEMTPEYGGIRYRIGSPMGSPFGRGFVPEQTFELGLQPAWDSPPVPAEALLISESLFSLSDVAVHDDVLLRWMG